LLDLKQSLKSQSKDFNIEKHEDKIIVNNYNKTIYNKQVTYAMDKKFEIYYSDFRTIPINFWGCKKAKILHKCLYSLNNNVLKWTFCNSQIAAVLYILPYHNYLTVTRAYLVYEYFNKVEIQISQCIDINNLCITIQYLVQEDVNEEYISYIPDLRKTELYPKYL
jgi:hypothetical protein